MTMVNSGLKGLKKNSFVENMFFMVPRINKIVVNFTNFGTSV